MFQIAKMEWSQTLWVNLNLQLLQEGVEGFIRTLRKLPKEVRALPVAFFLEGRMKEFKESLPLLLDLKNEALRERSAQRLAKTYFLPMIYHCVYIYIYSYTCYTYGPFFSTDTGETSWKEPELALT